MPDINLLKDTERPDENSRPKPAIPEGFTLSEPEKQDKKGFAGVFRSLFNRRPVPEQVVPPKGETTMGLTRNRTGERILTEKRKAAPSVIPLPDDEAFNVNLLTEDLVGGFSLRQKLMQLGFVALGGIVLVGLAYFGLTVYEKNVSQQIAKTKEELNSVNSQITSLRDKQELIVSTTRKTTAIKNLIDQHIRWTKFFDRLEHYISPAVTLGEVFTGDIAGSMTFTAKTSSYESVAAQYLILQQAVKNGDFIQSFTITGATKNTIDNIPVVTFTLGLELEPTLLENAPSPIASTTESTPQTP